MAMENLGCVLADMGAFGRVFDCGACGNIHLTIGPVSLLLTPEDYMKLVTMIHGSASRFEAWLEEKRRPLWCRSEHSHAESDIDPNRI